MPFINCVVWIALLAGALEPAQPRPVWEKGDVSVRLRGEALEIRHARGARVEIASFAFNFVEPERVTVTGADGDALRLTLSFGSTDGFRADFPRELPLTVTCADGTLHFSARHDALRHVTIRIRDRGEHYFGLIEKLYPHNAPTPDLRGETVDVDVYAEGERDYAENYASACSAFFMTSGGYGSFFDTFGRGRYRLGVGGVTEIYHQADALDWYLFFGADGGEIHSKYFGVIGRPKRVPIWACGPVVWRDLNRSSAELLDDLGRFSELRIPLTACMIDRPYSDGGHEWSRMNFSEKFARPSEWTRTIRETFGMELLTWVAPMTFTDPDFPGLLPGPKNYMDLTHPGALAEFERRLAAEQYSVGVRGHKMDRADETFPLTAQWHEPVPESAARNRYVYLYAKTVHDFLTRAHGSDHFNYARAAIHRTQPFLSALWGGDSRSNWMGMAGNQANAMRAAFQGFPVWGNDTGGYLGEGRIPEELYLRWIRWSAYNGLFEVKLDGAGGSGEDRPPWKYSARLQEVFRRACEERMRLLPTIYSRANTSYRDGVLMQPLAYAWPEDPNTYGVWDEYLFGGALLVAPVFEPGTRRDIYLPRGGWYALGDPAKTIAGGRTITLEVPLEVIPVFVRQNSIYVTGDIFRGSSRRWRGELEDAGKLEIHAWAGVPGSGTRFTYVDYADGDREKRMELGHENGRVTFRSEPLEADASIALRCPGKPAAATLDGRAVPFEYDAASQIVRLPLGARRGVRLELVME
ncbi:MAG: glycoside hydrolase family 31 protein [Acidobacteria bacterium]|nr:glycoside hydrolase family 31 protein [Acidobacteriota bacterium]